MAIVDDIRLFLQYKKQSSKIKKKSTLIGGLPFFIVRIMRLWKRKFCCRVCYKLMLLISEWSSLVHIIPYNISSVNFSCYAFYPYHFNWKDTNIFVSTKFHICVKFWLQFWWTVGLLEDTLCCELFNIMPKSVVDAEIHL